MAKLIEDITGCETRSCPWQAFGDPFVQQILEAVPWYEKGQLALYWPKPLHLHMQALSLYSRCVSQIRAHDQEIRIEEMKRKGGQHGH